MRRRIKKTARLGPARKQGTSFRIALALALAVCTTGTRAAPESIQLAQAEAPGPNGPPVPPPRSESPSAVPPGEAVLSPVPVDARRTPPRLPLEYPGLKLGSFLAFPSLDLSVMHDDNIYAERRDETSDYVTTLSPSIVLRSAWDRHALNLTTGADFDRYADYTKENVDDYWYGADGRLDFGKKFDIFGGAQLNREHEDRAEPDALSPFIASEPTLYDHTEAHLGAALKGKLLSVRLGGTFDRFNFQDVASVPGPIINMDDRDRDLHSLAARVSLNTGPRSALFVQYATDTRRYDSLFDDFGYQRDSDGYRAAAGWSFIARPRLSAEVFAGHMVQDYDDARLYDASKPYFGADVTWRPSNRDTVTGFIDRALEESTLPGASAYLDTTYGFRAERRISGDLSVNGRVAYTRSQYLGLDRLDKIIDAGAGVRYFLSSTVYVGADYRLIDRESDLPVAQYARNQIMLMLGMTPGRSKDYSLPSNEGLSIAGAGDAHPWSGLYAGAAAGYGTLHTETSGVRGDSGTDLGPMGDDGATGGLFLGIGTVHGKWYVGLEADAEGGNMDWDHAKLKAESRTASVEKNGSYGLGVRLGRVMPAGQLVYARVGAVRTSFDTYYAQNDPSVVAGAYDQEDTATGVRTGLGADIPAGRNVFVRLEYSYTNYKNYDATYATTTGPTTEAFNNDESVFRLGVGWLFGGQPAPTPPTPEVTASGFYVGAHGGHATLGSRLDGMHTDSGVPPAVPFSGDFSDDGAALGVFAGYGFHLGRVYLGVEIEADTGTAKWQHARDTSGGGGRDFGVEKKSDYGGGVRLGYSLRNATLLYARVGYIQGRFNTSYLKGNGTASDIDRSDILEGIRAGVGAELPMTRNTFLRLDYTHTNYEDYGFVTTHGGGTNADTMTFNNSENLMRVGLGFRF
jgi:opacity protein-like surface antigen